MPIGKAIKLAGYIATIELHLQFKNSIDYRAKMTEYINEAEQAILRSLHNDGLITGDSLLSERLKDRLINEFKNMVASMDETQWKKLYKAIPDGECR
jgi:hypothetical protein